MTNPFEDPNGTYEVLMNDEGQHSLWPVSAATPAGWRSTHGPASRQNCLDHIESSWTDLRPSSLRCATA